MRRMNNAATFKPIKLRNLEVPCAAIAVRASFSNFGRAFQRLRVVDASVFARISGFLIACAVLAIGKKAPPATGSPSSMTTRGCCVCSLAERTGARPMAG
jgi:hypothetical protein